MYIAIDFETTSLDYYGLRPIQVGVAHVPFTDHVGFVSMAWDINWEPGTYGMEIDPESLKINSFTLDRIFWGEEGYQDHQEVDEELSNTLKRIKQRLQLGNKDEELIPLGWNVGKFDMDIMRRFLPNSFALVSHRTRELNTAVALAAEVCGVDYQKLKQDCKDYSEDMTSRHNDITGSWHDAEWDAVASLYAWDFTKSFIRDNVE